MICDAKRYDVMYYLQDTGTERKKERERTKVGRKRVRGCDVLPAGHRDREHMMSPMLIHGLMMKGCRIWWTEGDSDRGVK